MDDLNLIKISDLPPTGHVSAGDIMPVVQSGVTKQVPYSAIRKYVNDGLGSAAFSANSDFEPSGSVLEVDLKAQARADAQNERIDRIEVAAYLLRNNKVFKAYRNKALMLADIANIPAQSILTVVSDPKNNSEINDINGQYHYDGNDFFKLPDDLRLQIEKYTDDILKNNKLIQGGSLNSINEIGHYSLQMAYQYTSLPTDFILDESSILTVAPSVDGFFEQRLHKLNSPNNVWTRSCRVSDGVGIWRSAANRYQRVYDNLDPLMIQQEGTYVVLEPKNLPHGYSQAVFVDVERFGGFLVRTVTSTDLTIKWTQQGVNQWENIPTNAIKTAGSGTLNAINRYGHYILPSDKAYTQLPDGFILDEMSILEVKPSTGGYFEQELYKLNSPNNRWRRSCRITDGAGVWRECFNRYQRLYDETDPKLITIAGTYVITNPINSPVGLTGALLLIVERIGGFIFRTIIQTDGFKAYRNVNSNSWVTDGSSLITNSRLSVDYNFKGLFTDGDFNTFTAEGNYLVNGVKLNGPTWMTDTAFLTVSRMGAFVVQRATSASSINLIAQRRGSLSGGIWSFPSDWVKIGSISEDNGGSTSSLANKTIVFIGDSIVEQGDYPERIGERYGSKIHKFGFGGCRAAAYPSNPLGYDKQCMYNIAKNINTGDFSSLIAGAEYTRDKHKDDNTPQAIEMSRVDWNAVDILVIAFGTNDWTGSILGSEFIADSAGGSFIGALCFSIEQILEKFPHIQIVLIGMSFRLRGNGNDDENSDNWLNKFGHSLKDYQNAILEVAEKYHIPALDMYRMSGVNELTHKKYLRDGVHPIANTGYQHWANKIGSFLNSAI